MTTTCIICAEIQNEEQIVCSKCEGSSCRSCFQTYLINSSLNPSCMHCRVNLSEDFVYQNTHLLWRQTEYTTFRNKLIFEKEQARLPEDQIYAELYTNAKSEVQKIETLIKQQSSNFKLFDRLKRSRHFYLQLITNFGKLKNNESKAVKRIYIKSCINGECKGFLNLDFKCGLCSIVVCKACHEIKNNNEHVCNNDIVASIKAIKLESRPCPTCTTLISKIDGCDQMWCTQCRTTFSWSTGNKEIGITHNPHFYEWARKNGGLPRNPTDVPVCNQYPLYWDIFNSFNENVRKSNMSDPSLSLQVMDTKDDDVSSIRIITEIYRYIHHIKQVLVDEIPLEATDNYDLRVRYLANELSTEKFKQLLQQRDAVFRKSLAARYIYDMVHQASGDLFQNLISGHTAIRVRADFKHLFQYGNECLRRLEDRYECRFQRLNYL